MCSPWGVFEVDVENMRGVERGLDWVLHHLAKKRLHITIANPFKFLSFRRDWSYHSSQGKTWKLFLLWWNLCEPPALLWWSMAQTHLWYHTFSHQGVVKQYIVAFYFQWKERKLQRWMLGAVLRVTGTPPKTAVALDILQVQHTTVGGVYGYEYDIFVLSYLSSMKKILFEVSECWKCRLAPTLF